MAVTCPAFAQAQPAPEPEAPVNAAPIPDPWHRYLNALLLPWARGNAERLDQTAAWCATLGTDAAPGS